MAPDAYTLPQLSRALGAPYRTLHSWVERDLVAPSIHRTKGTGRANLFDANDAVTVCVLLELRKSGVPYALLEQAAAKLRERETLAEPVYVLVNGKVDIVTDVEEAAAALGRGGVTVAYHTGEAVRRAAEITRSA
ncbi:MAG: helix-turn-helix domain-containing protein [Actinomycetota bacterium]|nr:helix-turn-helix domain-containing protein [Actinomycetota bacterium]MDQ5807124.1 helix-turn-helix domain-containing protein [Actinomycetota bacterium]